MTTEYTGIALDQLERRIDEVAQTAGDEDADLFEMTCLALALVAELRARQARLDSAWRLLGRCDMAFELIGEAKLIGPVKKTAKQLRAEIKKASGQ